MRLLGVGLGLSLMASWISIVNGAPTAPVPIDPTPTVKTAPAADPVFVGPCVPERIVRLGRPDGPPFLLHICADGSLLLRPVPDPDDAEATHAP